MVGFLDETLTDLRLFYPLHKKRDFFFLIYFHGNLDIISRINLPASRGNVIKLGEQWKCERPVLDKTDEKREQKSRTEDPMHLMESNEHDQIKNTGQDIAQLILAAPPTY
ncbi:uncharacterized protein LOC105170271 [Sesamum indicum]|uniref:Uncharacterized protein LOC105170271 n=1 Tax=Sesamum indicum TaxID=4182 RepID=A0A6I9TYZ9_SESIN|nr:uncharacterized protein LOC105170271 [Sesamum indicum]